MCPPGGTRLTGPPWPSSGDAPPPPPSPRTPRAARVAPPAAKPITDDKRGAQTSCGRGLYTLPSTPPPRTSCIPVDGGCCANLRFRSRETRRTVRASECNSVVRSEEARKAHWFQPPRVYYIQAPTFRNRISFLERLRNDGVFIFYYHYYYNFFRFFFFYFLDALTTTKNMPSTSLYATPGARVVDDGEKKEKNVRER